MAQKVTKVGNSAALILSKPLLEEGGIKIGTKVNVSYKADIGGYLVMPITTTKTKSSRSHEFNVWLNQFMKENGEILDELATR